MKHELTPIRNDLDKMRNEFAKALPAHITPDKLVRSVLNALQDNPYILSSCTHTSILKAAMTAAVLGLEVDNMIGQGYIVPFKGKAQFITGYKGYITLAYNSGYLLDGSVVRENDYFKYSLGLNPTLEHVPAKGNVKDRGEITHVYATARHSNNPAIFIVLDITEVHTKRDRSSGYKAYLMGKAKETPWVTDYSIMCLKTAIRALAPRLPLNVQRAAAIEQYHELDKDAYIDVTGNLRTSDEQAEKSKITFEQPILEL